MTERKIALFDVDNTIYNGYIIFPLAELQVKEGVISTDCLEQLQSDTQAYRLGKITYEIFARDAMRHWAIGLTGKSYLEVLTHTEAFLKGEGDNFFPYFNRVVHMLNEKKYDIYLVTAEPKFVAEAIKNIFPITDSAASEFEAVDGVFRGEAHVLDTGQEKNMAIQRLLGSRDTKDSIAFGDSVSDIDMLEKTTFPICIKRPNQASNQALRRYARSKGWEIVNPGSVDKKVRSLLDLT